ncbi:hypothetical protein J2S89_002541 [Arthrobacter bambusae]|nr:hypothetical protein [Arthrobacter bambusae]MDQ0099006.1 hypothetical protein [Arthrobacter bambusae]
MATRGETIVFTAWIVNDSGCRLHNVRLVPRSFTNEAMESLEYTSKPPEADLHVGTLSAGESAMLSFSYVVSAADHRYGGDLISAMEVTSMSRGRIIRDEHDAFVALNEHPYSLPGSPTGASGGQSTSRS